MLILLAVTVAVAINGGLFNSATKAKVETTMEAEKETILASMVPCYNNETGEYDLDKLQDNLPTGWTYANEIVITKAGKKFSVNTSGVIEEILEEIESGYVNFNDLKNPYTKITLNNPNFVENSLNIARLTDDKDEYIEEGFEINDANEERIYSLKVLEDDEIFEYTLYFSDSEGDNCWIYYPRTIGDKIKGWYYDGYDGEESIESHPLPIIENCYIVTLDPTWIQAMCSDLLIIE